MKEELNLEKKHDQGLDESYEAAQNSYENEGSEDNDIAESSDDNSKDGVKVLVDFTKNFPKSILLLRLEPKPIEDDLHNKVETEVKAPKKQIKEEEEKILRSLLKRKVVLKKKRL